MNFHQLNRESRKEFDVAKSAEIQSWLRYEAVTAALRSQCHHRDIMKMWWALRCKESGTPKARLVIIGYHDPLVGPEFEPKHQWRYVVEELSTKACYGLCVSGLSDVTSVTRRVRRLSRDRLFDSW